MKRIAITGCGSGLGKAMMNEARERGHYVFPHFRNIDIHTKLGVLEEPYITGGLNDFGFSDRFEEEMKIRNIDTFINNAAMYSGGPLENLTETHIKHVVNVNVSSQILLIRKAFKRFKKMKRGLIININSLSYQQPAKNETIYCATKFALKGFSKALQLEAIGTGVEIIDVHPGGIQTRMTKTRDNFSTLMKAEDVASQVIDLVDRNSGYVNEIVLRKRNESSSS